MAQNPNDALKKADEALKKMVEEKNRQKMEADKQAIMESVGRELPGLVAPLLHQVAAASRLNTDEVISAIHGITINPPAVNVTTPEAQVTVSHEMPPMPEMPAIDTSGIESAISRGIANAKFPAPNVTVNPAKLPDFPAFPEIPDFPSEVSIKGVDKKTPFPVMMMDGNGKPMQFPVSGGGGGGRSDFFTIKDIQTSAGLSIIDNDGFVKVTGNFSVSASNSSTQSIDSSGNPYSAANPLPVTFTGSSSTSMSLVNADGTYYNSDNPLPITGSLSTTPGATFFASDAVGSTNLIQIGGIGVATGLNETNAGVLRTVLMTDSVVSVNIVSGSSSGAIGQGDEASATRVVIAGNSDASVVVNSGTLTTVTTLTSVTNSIQATLVDSTGIGYSGSNPVPVTISGAGSSTASALIDSSGVQYSGSNPLPISGAVSQSGTWNIGTVTTLTGVTNSVASALIDSSGVQYSTSNPLPIGDAGGSITVDGTVAVSGVTGSIGATILNGEGVARDTWGSSQVGTWNIGTVTTVTGVTNSIQSALIDSSGIQYSGSNPVPIGGAVTQSGTWNIGTVTTVTGVTNSIQSALIDSTGVQYSGSNPFPVTMASPIAQGDAASAIRVIIAGNSDASVVVNSGTITTVSAVTGITNSVAVVALDRDGNPLTTGPIAQGDSATALRVILAGNSDASVVVNSGTITTVTTLTSITNSVASAIVDSTGIQYSGSNPFAVSVRDSYGSTITSFGSGDSKGLAVAIVDAAGAQITSFGGGTQYAEGATASTYTGTAVIFAEASTDAAKVVSSVDPLPVTLSTALSSSIDSVLSRPISLRGNISTAYATLSTNTETTLLAASAGNFLDLVWVKFANTSSGAVTLDLRDSSAGNIVDTYEVPANGVVGISMAVPYPQGNQGNAWTVDFNDSDLTNTTVYVSGMFHKTT